MRLVTTLTAMVARRLLSTGRRAFAYHVNYDLNRDLTIVDTKVDEQRRKSFVNRIKRAGPIIDWPSMIVDKRLNKTQNLVRLMASIIRCQADLDGNVIESLIAHLQQNKPGETNPVYEAHYCTLLLIANLEPSPEREVRERLTNLASTHNSALKFPIFNEVLSRLASRSKDDAIFVRQFMKDHSNAYKSTITLVQAFLKFNMFKESLEHIKQLNEQIQINEPAVLFFSNAYQTNDQREAKLNLIRFFADRRATMDMSSRNDVEETVKSLGFSDQGRAVINTDHICQRCRTKMKVLSDEEFDRLAEAVKAKVIIRSGDKYINTTPEELARFTQFVGDLSRKNIKFDLVMDALNVMNVKNATRYAPNVPTTQSYRKLGTYRDTNLMKTVLLTVLNDCLKQFNRIMISGRVHMKRWHELNKFMEKNINQVSHFYTENYSADDPFMLYLAMQSKSSYIMSNDFFRREQFHLGQNDGQLLDRLLEYRQIKLTKGLEFIYPENCEIVINVSDDAIHVPLLTDSGCYWICAKKSTK